MKLGLPSIDISNGPLAFSCARAMSSYVDALTGYGDMGAPSITVDSLYPSDRRIIEHEGAENRPLDGTKTFEHSPKESRRKGELRALLPFPLGGFSALPHTEARLVTMRPAVTCDWRPRQRRLVWCGAAYRLATAAPLPPLTYVASSLGCEFDCLVQELDKQGYQSQESVQPIHRQITSLRRRQHCRFAGLI